VSISVALRTPARTVVASSDALVDNFITYLSGCVKPDHTQGQRADLGLLLSPRMGNRPKQLGSWALDNGLFHHFDKPARDFPEKRFFDILNRELPENASNCLFAVVPDVVYNAAATLKRFPQWVDRIAAYGVPVAFAAQDGHDKMISDIPWNDFDVLFVGGSTCQCKRCNPRGKGLVKHDPTGGWKLDPARAGAVIDEGLARGKRVHMARVNSGGRLAKSQRMGAHSADGTFLGMAGGQDGLDKVHGWLDTLNQSIDTAFIDEELS
jgi:hypothetical protein